MLTGHPLCCCLSVSDLQNIKKGKKMHVYPPHNDFFLNKEVLVNLSVSHRNHQTTCHRGQKKCCISSYCCVKTSLKFSPLSWVLSSWEAIGGNTVSQVLMHCSGTWGRKWELCTRSSSAESAPAPPCPSEQVCSHGLSQICRVAREPCSDKLQTALQSSVSQPGSDCSSSAFTLAANKASKILASIPFLHSKVPFTHQ